MVTFFLGDEEYAVDVMAVREIIELTEITRTVNNPPYLEGVIDLRGTVIPVISLRTCFGLPPAPKGAPGCIAVLDLGGELKGCMVDDISEVIRVTPEQILPPVDLATQPWISGILMWEQRLVVVMEPERLF